MKIYQRVTLSIYFKRTTPNTEEEIEAVCERYKGEREGGGTNLCTGERDVSFDFKSLKNAQQAIDALKKKFGNRVILK